MGIKLGDLVIKNELELSSLAGKKVAIDAFNALYQFLSIIRQPDGTPLMDSKKRVTSHLSGLFYRTIKLKEFGIEPCYVFDGEPPELKYVTLGERAAVKKEAVKKLAVAKEAEDEEAMRKYSMMSTRLTDAMIENSKSLLTAMGIPVVQAPSEGESQAAFMAAEGDVHAVASQDFDSLLFGGPRLIRNLTLSGKRKLPNKPVYVDVEPELIDLQETLKELQ